MGIRLSQKCFEKGEKKMFCKNCGGKINQNDKFCANCGVVIEQTQVSQHMREAQRQKKQRGIPAGAIAGIIVASVLSFTAVALGTIGTISWYNNPINRIDRAIERGDVETVVRLYGRLERESDEWTVQREMLGLAKELQDSYLDGETEYDEVMDTYDLLDEEVLAENSSFRKIRKKVEDVEASREAFAEADALFGEGDYVGAREKYMLVIAEDELNYDDACDAIEECGKKITGSLISTWSAEYDFGDWLYYGDDYSLPAKIVFDFKENGMGSMSVEIINKDMWVAAFIDDYMVLFEEYYGVSEDEQEEFLQYMGYESMEEWVEDVEDEVDYFEGEYDTFQYSYDGELLSVWSDDDDGEDLVADLEEDTLTFSTTSDGSDYWYWMGLDLPLVLQRDNTAI